MRVIKYTTEHLICIEARDMKNQLHHQIFEKENKETPMAVYSPEFGTLQLIESFPKPESDYIYFNEMCEIIKFLYSLKQTPENTPEQ